MNDLTIFKQYKRAKLISKDLSKALEVLDESIKKIRPLIKYSVILETFYMLQNSRIILEIQLNQHKRIVAQYDEHIKNKRSK